ncbi:unnamed protein product [Nezara viridula]|uniref:EF-hand domain-containing protein n=1 Tax=Nezara viridula TaxID=85310 RepID=A0A9P0HDV5_NEZVI|nr:unnamed protein product [Nezara viridula]
MDTPDSAESSDEVRKVPTKLTKKRRPTGRMKEVMKKLRLSSHEPVPDCYISLEEFKEACQLIGEHLDQPQEEAIDICKSMDMNKDGLVDLNEFLETFRLVENQHSLDMEFDEEDI